jgi:hypothetical protein
MGSEALSTALAMEGYKGGSRATSGRLALNTIDDGEHSTYVAVPIKLRDVRLSDKAELKAMTTHAMKRVFG